GAASNRLQTTVSNLQSMQANMSASLSRIRDVDIASETSALARNQVLAQAGAAVLSQANQSPQLALSLLRG
ncbi:MAG: flagellin FliC, partial [Deltaproteobacteria bacterium]|nr:flagellin FliC [Deltaproteobacteria bacterium]MBI5513500.1 flagellin FliC [Deltaproteobacteria bacterium]